MSKTIHFCAEKLNKESGKWELLLLLREEYKALNDADYEEGDDIQYEYPYDPALVPFERYESGSGILAELLGTSGSRLYDINPIATMPRGIPTGACPGTIRRMEHLSDVGYVSLGELLEYDWNATLPNWDMNVAEAAPFFWLRVVPALIKAAGGIGDPWNVRLIYGFSY